MIVEFVSVKNGLWDLLNNFLRNKVKEKSSVAQGIANKTLIHEGNGYSFSMLKEKQDMDFQTASGNFQITKEELPTLSLKEIVRKVEGVAENMAEQMERGLIETLSRAVGITSPANAKPLTHETILEHLEMMNVGFYDDDPKKPHQLSLIVAPGMDRILQEQWDSMSEEEQKKFKERQQDIYAKKYEEYSTREQRRKLVD